MSVVTAALLPLSLVSVACIVMFCDERSSMCFGPLYYLFAIAVPKASKAFLNGCPGGPSILYCCGEFDELIHFLERGLMVTP
jgi:hypothetical protein